MHNKPMAEKTTNRRPYYRIVSTVIVWTFLLNAFAFDLALAAQDSLLRAVRPEETRAVGMMTPADAAGQEGRRGLMDATFRVEIDERIRQEARAALVDNTNYAIRCLYHTASSEEAPDLPRARDILGIKYEGHPARGAIVEKGVAEFKASLARFRGLACFRALDRFPAVRIVVNSNMENEYMEAGQRLYPLLLRVMPLDRNTITLNVPNEEVARQLNYRNIMIPVIFALSDPNMGWSFGNLEAEGIFDPHMVVLAHHCWHTGPGHQMEYYDDAERDRVLGGINITSVGMVSDEGTPEEASREQGQVRDVLREMLTWRKEDNLPWGLFYSYILSVFQGRCHSRGRPEIVICDSTVDVPGTQGNPAAFHIAENRIYINRFFMGEYKIPEGGAKRLVVSNSFTSKGVLCAFLLEEVFHADTNITKAEEVRVASRKQLAQLSTAVLMELIARVDEPGRQAKRFFSTLCVKTLHETIIAARNQRRNRELRGLLGNPGHIGFRDRFYGRTLEEMGTLLHLEHENIHNLIADWFYFKRRAALGEEKARLLGETLGAPWFGIGAALDSAHQAVVPFVEIGGEILMADLRLSQHENTYTIFAHHKGRGVRPIGECAVRPEQGAHRLLFTFREGYEAFRRSSDVLTAITNVVYRNTPAMANSPVTIHIDDINEIPADDRPFAIIHKNGGKALERIYAEEKPAEPEEKSEDRIEITGKLEPVDDPHSYYIDRDIAGRNVRIRISHGLVGDLVGVAERVADNIARAMRAIMEFPLEEGFGIDRSVEALQGSLSKVEAFSVITGQLGVYELASLHYSKGPNWPESLTVYIDGQAERGLLQSLDGNDFGFLIICSALNSGGQLGWHINAIKARITVVSGANELFNHIFQERPMEQGGAEPRPGEGYEGIVVVTRIRMADGSYAAGRITGPNEMEFGVSRGKGHFTPQRLPQDVQEGVRLAVQAALQSGAVDRAIGRRPEAARVPAEPLAQARPRVWQHGGYTYVDTGISVRPVSGGTSFNVIGRFQPGGLVQITELGRWDSERERFIPIDFPDEIVEEAFRIVDEAAEPAAEGGLPGRGGEELKRQP